MIVTILKKKDKQYLRVLGMTDQKVGGAITDATVKATMLTTAGAEIPEIKDLALASTGTSGDYEGVIAASFDPPALEGYVLKIRAEQNGELLFEIDRSVTVVVRDS